MELADWIEGYARAWEQDDADLLLTLFTEDASYRSSPFREPNRGHDGIRAYWTRAAGTQTGVKVRMGDPVVEGNIVAVEWWTTMDDADDGTVTLPGCLLLQFAPDGRCFDLREYWNVEAGTAEPHEGWGSWRRG
jgi:ketosteroid isomerase-like protein